METEDSNRETRVNGSQDCVLRLLESGWSTIVPSHRLTALSSQALATARRLFALPFERKCSFARPEFGGHVGWRQASTDERPDEVWQVRLSDDTEHWPSELRTERRFVNELGLLSAQLTADILATLVAEEPALSLVRNLVSSERTVVRLLHYKSRACTFGFGPHTDLGTATVFAGETVDALELQDQNGEWIRPRSQLVLAAGEVLARCGEGRIRAACHRVVPLTEERWAVAAFVHPEPDFVIGFDEDGSSLTAQRFFDRAMSSYNQRRDTSTAINDSPEGSGSERNLPK